MEEEHHKRAGRRNWKRRKLKFYFLNWRLIGLNMLWGGWNWSFSEARWIHWECMNDVLKRCCREIIKWPVKLVTVPKSMSDFQAITDGSGFPYLTSCSKVILAQEVKMEEVALPDQPPIIIPILSILPDAMASKYESENNLVRSDTQAWTRMKEIPPKLGVKSKEYVKIVRRLLELKMVRLLPVKQVKVVNGLQCVTKSNGKQRLIFDGRPVNQVLQDPDKVSLPEFALLEDWEVSENDSVRFGKLDLDNFYHRLGVPDWMVQYLALPAVKAKHFKLGEGWLHPACLTLLMGLSHAVLLAQTAHMFVLRNAKLGSRINAKVERSSELWVVVYIDDVIIAAKHERAQEAAAKVNDNIVDLLHIYQDCGLIVNKKKLIYASNAVEGLGCNFSERKGIFPKAEKIMRVIGATKYLLNQEWVCPKIVEKILGHWVWFILLKRPLYSQVFSTYKWLHHSDSTALRRLWKSVRREFAILIIFADLCTMSWSRQFSSRLIATDASLQGAGACDLDASNVVIPRVYGGNTDLQAWGTWRTKINKQWRKKEHINVLELRALVWAVLSYLPDRQQHHLRWTVYSDSEVVIGAEFRMSQSSKRRLTLGLANSTIRSYARAIAKFMDEVETVCFDDLDSQLVNYIQLFPPLQQRPNIEKIGCAFRHFFPDLAINLPRLNRYAHQLRRQYRGITKPPMIWDVVLMVIRQLVSLGFPTTALGVWLQYDCFLRPAELCGLLTQHIAFPGGCLLGSQAKFVLLLLPKAKTGPLQSVRVKSNTISELLSKLVNKEAPTVSLFPSYSVYRQRLGKALSLLGVGHIGYTPHSIRHGAATMALINRGEEALPSIMFRGRWESSAGKAYLQMGAAALLYAELPPTLIAQAKFHANSLPEIFHFASFTPKV